MDKNKGSIYVLVHGAWHGAWCWDNIVPYLTEAGNTVIAFDLPGHNQDPAPLAEQDLERYARKVETVILEQNEPVILVGHSLGGMVISQAAEYCPDQIKKLIYVCAFLPQNGQSADGPTALRPTDWSEMEKSGFVTMSSDGKVTMLSKEFAMNGCFNDVINEEAEKRLPDWAAKQPQVSTRLPRSANDLNGYQGCM